MPAGMRLSKYRAKSLHSPVSTLSAGAVSSNCGWAMMVCAGGVVIVVVPVLLLLVLVVLVLVLGG